MEKKFKKMKDYLEVTLTDEQPIKLPVDKDVVQIGKFDMTQIQQIDLEKVPVLIDFVQEQIDNATAQLDMVNKKLASKELKDIEGIDQELVKACQDKINKGTKIFKQKMLALNDHIAKVSNKKQLLEQKEYITKQIEPMQKELDDMKKAMA